METSKIRLLIVDDHALIRDGLGKIFSFHEDIEVVGQAPDGAAACQMAMHLNVDVVLMDINMPGMNGIEATKLIKAQRPETGIIALTIHDDDEYVSELVKAGVSAYILKDVESDALVDTVRAVARGETVFHSKITKKLLGEFQRLAGINRLEEPLSRREMEVLVLITRGKSNREIGETLFISEKTVKNHLTNIFRKIDVTDRTQAALYAVKNRLVKL